MNRRGFLTRSGLALGALIVGDEVLEAMDRLAHRKVWALGGVRGVFDVRAYGAVGDGITNDFTAFQRAVDEAAKHEGVVHIPVGDYFVSRSVHLGRRANIQGAGLGTIVRTRSHIPVFTAGVLA